MLLTTATAGGIVVQVSEFSMLHAAFAAVGVAPVLAGTDQAEVVLTPDHLPPAVAANRGGIPRCQRVGLGERQAIAGAAPVRVLGHLPAESSGELGDAFEPVVREQRLEPGCRGPYRLQEEPRVAGRVPIAEPHGPGAGGPPLVAARVVPVGNGDDRVVAGLVHVCRPVSPSRPVRARAGRREVVQRGAGDGGRLASGTVLHAEIGHGHARHRGREPGHERRVRRLPVRLHPGWLSAARHQVLGNC